MDVIEKIVEEVKTKMQNDPAHDFDHILRVYKTAEMLSKKEKANTKLVRAAALLHDIITFPKNDSLSKSSAIKSAEEAKKLLEKYNFSSDEITIVTDAIRDHSYSRNKIPKTIEGKVLQDADRLDALGAIGIARTFAVAGAENRPLYNDLDPFCESRDPNDKRWTIDHFFNKLLKLENMMNTKSAKSEAKRRTQIIKNYLKDLKREL